MGLLSSAEYNGTAYANIYDHLYLVDGGKWTELSPLRSHNLKDLKSDKNDVLWAVYNNNIQISPDNGLNWETLSIPATSISDVKFFGDAILLNSWGNIFAQHMDSLDGEWVQIYDSEFEDFTVTSDSTIYISEYWFNIKKSTDFGETWTNTEWANNGISSTPGVLTSKGERLFVGTYWDGVLYSDDQGDTWHVSEGVPSNVGVSQIYIIDDAIYALSRDQLRTTGLFRSDDNGETFKKLDLGLSIYSKRDISNLTSDNGLLILNTGHLGFLMSSDQGETWEEINNGYDNVQPHHVKAIQTDSNGTIWALMGANGVGPRATWGVLKSNDSGLSWDFADSGIVDYYRTLEGIGVTPNGSVFASGYEVGTIHSSTDGGDTWDSQTIMRPADPDDPDGEPSGITTINSIVSKNNDTLYAGSYFDGILRTVDGGQNWDFYNSGLPNRPGVRSLTTDEDRIYAIIASQVGYEGLYQKTDGQDWEKLSSKLLDDLVKHNTALFGFFRDSVHVSRDNGESWVEFITGIPDGARISTLMILDEADTNYGESLLIAATNRGLFQSGVDTASFTQISEVEANTLHWDNLKNRLILGADTGIYFSELEKQEAVSISSGEVPNEFVLEQNYPNPFNPTTVISYQIPVSSDVHLEVFNMLGQRVATVIKERQNAGHHSVTFDASALSSGIYLYRIQAGEFSETRRLTLIK